MRPTLLYYYIVMLALCRLSTDPKIHDLEASIYAFIATFIEMFVKPVHISYICCTLKWIIQLMYRNGTTWCTEVVLAKLTCTEVDHHCTEVDMYRYGPPLCTEMDMYRYGPTPTVRLPNQMSSVLVLGSFVSCFPITVIGKNANFTAKYN